MHAVALLTARGNNTLADKNVLPLLGKPLCQYPAEAARRSKRISSFFVSSENEAILRASEAVGYRRILRPEEFAQPTSRHYDVLVHALREIRASGTEPDVLVVLLGNSATVKTSWIDDCLAILEKNPEATAAVPVLQDSDHHPLRAKKTGAGGYLESFFPGANSISSNRQDLEKSYFLCHNFWALRVKGALESNDGQGPWPFMGRNVVPYVVEEAFDVHDLTDLERSERWLRRELPGGREG